MLATPLLCESDKPKSILDRMSTEKSRTKSSKDSKGTKSSSKEKSKDSSKSSGHGTRRDTNVQSHLTANNFIAQISMAVIDNKSEDPADIDSKDDVEQTVDPDWMYDYGKHLFEKYVKNSAELAINTSYNIRRDLWQIYAKKTNEEAFQKILLMHHEDLAAVRLSAKEEQLLIQTYLYHSFDLAFHSVWALLKSDTFFRFQQTKQYKKLCEQKDAQKLEEARAQRDREYSKSLKDHESIQYLEMSSNQNVNIVEEEKKESELVIGNDDLLGDIFDDDTIIKS